MQKAQLMNHKFISKKHELILGCMVGAILIVTAAGLDYAKTTQSYCVDSSGICFKDDSEFLLLPDTQGNKRLYEGQTWALSWGDANNNLWPDLYLNHHRLLNTEKRFPSSHLILDLGKNNLNWEYRELPGQDQHSALFFDFDGDGDMEIFELIGGRSGNASEENTTDYNSLHDSFMPTDSAYIKAKDIGLHQPAARGRYAVPFIHKDALHLAVMNAPREDGKYGPVFLRRGHEGIFTASDIFYKDCFINPCTEQAIAIEKYRDIVFGFVDDDNLADIVLFDAIKENGADIFLNSSDGVFEHTNRAMSDKNTKFALILPTTNKSTFRLMLANHKEINILSSYNSNENAGRIIKLNFKKGKLGKLVDIATADFNNDTWSDVISLHNTKDGIPSVVLWLGSSAGEFSKHVFQMQNLGTDARNLAIADFNLDGELDVVFGGGKGRPWPDNDGRYVLWSGKTDGNWLEIDLVDDHGLRGLNSKITVEMEGKVLTRGQFGGVRGEVQDHMRIHFGLGDNEVAAVTVNWSDGDATHLPAVKANQLIEIRK